MARTVKLKGIRFGKRKKARRRKRKGLVVTPRAKMAMRDIFAPDTVQRLQEDIPAATLNEQLYGRLHLGRPQIGGSKPAGKS